MTEARQSVQVGELLSWEGKEHELEVELSGIEQKLWVATFAAATGTPSTKAIVADSMIRALRDGFYVPKLPLRRGDKNG